MFLRTAIIVCPDIAAIRRFTPTGVGTIASDIVSNRQKAVHPHGRGDNFSTMRDVLDSFGSPPRAWGQWRTGAPRTGHRRFTPTGVGTIPCSIEFWEFDSVHPHGRGDNATAVPHPQSQDGSPPRAWGQSGASAPAPPQCRFTPTSVGTIAQRALTHRCAPVHPHGRGDNGIAPSRPTNGAGSPPRAWGQYLAGDGLGEEGRFTPTGVGTIAAGAS